MRVSNTDRERIAARLQQASADGRLELDELDERLRATYAAKTFAELEPLTRDLPEPEATDTDPAASPDAAAAPGTPAGARQRPTSRWALAVMGGFTRVGTWVVPRRFRSLVLMGGGKIDLRYARFADTDTKIRIFAMMGGVQVIVPPEAHVIANGVGIMGGWGQPPDGPATPGGPRITISGLAVMGGVDVTRRRRKKSEQSGSQEAVDPS